MSQEWAEKSSVPLIGNRGMTGFIKGEVPWLVGGGIALPIALPLAAHRMSQRGTVNLEPMAEFRLAHQ